MSIATMEDSRHAEQRGAILQALRQDYVNKMTSVKALAGSLDLLGYSMTGEGLQFSLSLLADSGYIAIWRAEDLPGYRSDRINDVRRDVILFARLTPKGLLLIDAKIPADPNVRF